MDRHETYGEQQDREARQMKWGGIGIAVLVAMIIVGIAFAMSSERISSGEACVVRAHGKSIGVAEPGWEWMVPGRDSLECYTTRVQSLEFTGTDSTDANFMDIAIGHKSADGVNLNVAAILKFETPAGNLIEIYDNYGRTTDELVEKHIQDTVRRHTREVLEERTIEEIYPGGMAETSALIQEELGPSLAARGVVMESFALTAVDPSEEYKNAVQQQIEQQQTAALEAERVTVEEQIAEQLRVKARGEADAAVIAAEGDAEANEIRTESLTPEILQLEYLETLRTINWAIFGPDDVQPIMPIATPASD